MCKKVYLIVRKNHLRASKIMQKRVREAPNVEILFEHETVSLFGNDTLEGAVLVKHKGKPSEEKRIIDISGLFLAIGHHPNSELFKDYLDRDEVGYIKTIHYGSPKTKIPGVFVAGDVGDPIYRQAITAAGSGCRAAIEAERYLFELGI
jgi:thioredoxin reductase (NADPH)